MEVKDVQEPPKVPRLQMNMVVGSATNKFLPKQEEPLQTFESTNYSK